MPNNAPDFCVVIPARLSSARLPNKLLLDVAGKPLIQWVYESAIQSDASEVVVATDSQQIAARVEGLGGKVCMTSEDHKSGTDRIAEAVEKLGWDDAAVVVNLQGDEPFIIPADINSVAGLLVTQSDAVMATLAMPIFDPADPHTVKVVRDAKNFALYFSRAPIPYACSNNASAGYLGHVGIYAYRCKTIRHFARTSRAPSEAAEGLEQLRILHNGGRIYVGDAQSSVFQGINTEDDLEQARQMMQTPSLAPTRDS